MSGATLKRHSCPGCGGMNDYDLAIDGYRCENCKIIWPGRLTDWVGPTHLEDHGAYRLVATGWPEEHPNAGESGDRP